MSYNHNKVLRKLAREKTTVKDEAQSGKVIGDRGCCCAMIPCYSMGDCKHLHVIKVGHMVTLLYKIVGLRAADLLRRSAAGSYVA
jgi:hypothetical protein